MPLLLELIERLSGEEFMEEVKLRSEDDEDGDGDEAKAEDVDVLALIRFCVVCVL